MKVRQLIELLEQYDPEALVVWKDWTEDRRFGIVRELGVVNVQGIQLGVDHTDFGTIPVLPWKDCSPQADGPYPGVQLGA